MTLNDVLRGVSLIETVPSRLAGAEVAGLEYDSRKVGKDFLFWAFSGARVDGRVFAAQAMERGALAVALRDAANHVGWVRLRG